RIATARGSSAAEKPLRTRAKLYSGRMPMPRVASVVISCCCAANASAVQRRSSAVETIPPARATRCASEGAFSTTIARCPSATGGSAPPTRPRQELCSSGALLPGEPVAASSEAAAATATSASRPTLEGLGVGIERKVLRMGDGVRVPRGRRDHRRVVAAEGKRRERRAGERGAQLRVGGDAADDGDAVGAGALDPVDERAHDRPLVGGGEVGAAALELVRRQVADGVEERRLDAGEREIEAVDARDREVVGLGVALAREPVDRGAARVAEPEQPRALVERLAGGVVERRPEDAEAAVILHVEQQRVAAAR